VLQFFDFSEWTYHLKIKRGENYEHKKKYNSNIYYHRSCDNNSGLFSVRWRAMDKRDDAWKRVDKHSPFELGTGSNQFGYRVPARFGSRQEEMVIDYRNSLALSLKTPNSI